MHIKLKENEHIRDTYRQSKTVLLKPAFVAISVICITWYLATQYQVMDQVLLPFQLLVLIMIGYFLKAVAIWRLNIYYITNQRLIKVAHLGPFKRVVIETPHERILNVSYKTTGITSILFKYGDVIVQVVGLMEPVILSHIAHPAKIKDYIWEIHQRMVKTQGIFSANDLNHYQERTGYTKHGQKISP